MLLKAAFGAQLLDGGSSESLSGEKPMETAGMGNSQRLAFQSMSTLFVFSFCFFSLNRETSERKHLSFI